MKESKKAGIRGTRHRRPNVRRLKISATSRPVHGTERDVPCKNRSKSLRAAFRDGKRNAIDYRRRAAKQPAAASTSITLAGSGTGTVLIA